MITTDLRFRANVLCSDKLPDSLDHLNLAKGYCLHTEQLMDIDKEISTSDSWTYASTISWFFILIHEGILDSKTLEQWNPEEQEWVKIRSSISLGRIIRKLVEVIKMIQEHGYWPADQEKQITAALEAAKKVVK